jgi:hypothetical protein
MRRVTPLPRAAVVRGVDGVVTSGLGGTSGNGCCFDSISAGAYALRGLHGPPQIFPFGPTHGALQSCLRPFIAINFVTC